MHLALQVDLYLLLDLADLVVPGSPLGQESIEARADPGSRVNLEDPQVPVILRGTKLIIAPKILKNGDMPIGPAVGSLRERNVSQAERIRVEMRTSKTGTMTMRRWASN